MKGKIIYTVFFGAFILVGLGCAIYGFVMLARYHSAEKVSATVISAEYDYVKDVADVSFLYIKDGVGVEQTARFRDAKFENGEYPYYEGKEIVVRLDGAGNVVQFGTAEILATVAGCLFVFFGAGFLYFGVLRKRNLLDVAYEYEQAMVLPEEVSDETAKYEACADQLSRLPQKSFERMAGETLVWRNRIGDRFKTYTVWQNIAFVCYFVLPMILFSVYPLFWGRKVTAGIVASAVFGWFFAALILGMVGKLLYSLWWGLLVRRGSFREKQFATVECCAFESSAEFASGDFSRTHTIFKKFKVVATVCGKRSVGYVKGNLPPARGTVLKVLVRPKKYGRWIIDRE